MKLFLKPPNFTILAASILAVVVLSIPAMFIVNFRPKFAFHVFVQNPYRRKMVEMSDDQVRELLRKGDEVPNSVLAEHGFMPQNNDRFLMVALNPDETIDLGNVRCGTLSDLSPLEKKLREIFTNRERNGLVDEDTLNPLTDVVLRAPLKASYGSVVRVIDSLKTAGADPIMLQLDGLETVR